MLPMVPASQAKTTVFIDLPCFGMFAKQGESLGQARVIDITRQFAMDGGSIGQNIEQVRVGTTLSSSRFTRLPEGGAHLFRGAFSEARCQPFFKLALQKRLACGTLVQRLHLLAHR